MRTVAIIQARLGSSRLPRKVLLPIAGKPVLEHVVERVRRSRLIDDIIIATTNEPVDQEIIFWCDKNKILVYAGSSDDVLDRYFQAATKFKADTIVRITADCPLIDPDVIDAVIKKHHESGASYTSNTLVLSYPDGLDVEVFSFTALKRAWENAKLSSEREHVTPFIRNDKTLITASLEYSEDLSQKRWTLDYPEDYDFINHIFTGLYKKDPGFGMEEILSFLKTHPRLESINHEISRNTGYQKSLENDFIIKD